ncbi:hypothetical protein [Laceyella putida]|uniref:YtkA-like domain-containing protein n=1 Tax=Laceyella putida TaxID=110101 RepID=A0ABW2RQT0_9BACL
MKKKPFLFTIPVVASLILAGCGAAQEQDHNGHGNQQQGHEQHQQATEKPAQKVQVNWTFDSQPTANQPKGLTIQVNDQTGKPVNEFEINHEKKMHLIIVSEDLSHFDHLHPNYQGNGKFKVETNFPQGGKYKLYADFIPQGGNEATEPKWVEVKGATSQKQPLQPDAILVKTVDGKEVSLKFDSTPQANQETMLTFHIKDAKTKQPITKLEKYLGAVGHVVIISSDAEQYLHVHPADENATGPDAMFHTTFPKAGVYKIWGQFQHQGKVFTVPFVVNVS